MQLPFTAAQFFEVFRRYNEAVWPAPIALTVVAAAALALAFVPRRWAGMAISASLAFLWLWLGVVYHAMFFASINPAALGFAALSVAAAGAFAWHGVARRRLAFRCTRSIRSLVGLALVLFSLTVYPAWATLAGHRYPAMPTFGLPCPTTLFTIGMLCLLVRPYPRWPLVVPILWCIVGSQAAFLLGVPQDLALLPAAAVGVLLAMRPNAPRAMPKPGA